MARLPDHVQVLTTLDSQDAAVALAQKVVAARRAACAQVSGPVTSVYRWQGDVEQATEWYCVMKTTGAAYEALAAWIGQHHPYDTPELIATPVVAGAPDYLDWVTAETTGAATD
jgi:periplasmic divalent cation tolerance protein